jgi:hypothetical protein
LLIRIFFEVEAQCVSLKWVVKKILATHFLFIKPPVFMMEKQVADEEKTYYYRLNGDGIPPI